MQVIGLCRFSYPALGGFQVAHDTAQAREAYLYDPARMEERLRHFEAITLPGLKAQTDPDYTLLILIGESLPETYRTRLEALVADVPQARIIARPPENHRAVCKSVINAARDMSLPCIQFRHDDDDAVAVTFVEQLRTTAMDCAGLLQKHKLVGIDFNRGYVMQVDDQSILAAPNMTPYWGVALAMAVQPGVAQTIMNFSHKRLARFMPTVTYTDAPMYVRGQNAFNDSGLGHPGKPLDLRPLSPEDRQVFKEIFAIDADHISKVFSNG